MVVAVTDVTMYFKQEELMNKLNLNSKITAAGVTSTGDVFIKMNIERKTL